ncbi:MAG: MFS transporter [Candidatus Thermoplasmatota archaeon]|uniref:MFS transporter n=1 Tax=Candidatus Sysuiplasma superficiale TaxID=2823368 RepID=A0A8J7YSQ1_9ARCH|nr:MFS transporter [Candidatus Sysuiplasma superficiale]MCL4347178.1 MFS transporter [Candidatus Thermoplasmatota archaeon]
MARSIFRSEFAYLAVTLSLMTVAARATNNMMLTTIPLLGRYSLHLSNTQVGGLEAVAFIATFAATSYFNQKAGGRTRRISFIMSNILIAFSMLLYYYSSAFTIWVITVAAGFASGIVMPNLITAASAAGELRSVERLLAIYTTSLSASLIIGPLIETELLRFVSYREIFIPFSAIAAVAAVISFTVRFPVEGAKRSGIEALRAPGFAASVLSNSTYSVPFAAITTFLAIYASDRFDVSRSLAYLSFIPFFIVSFAVRLSLAIFPRRNLRTLFFISMGITIAGLAALASIPSYVLFAAVVASLGFPHGAVYPMSTIFIARGTEKDLRSAVNSYFIALNNVIFAAVPFIFGAISSMIGLGMSFALLILPVGVSAFLFIVLFGRHEMLGPAKSQVP